MEFFWPFITIINYYFRFAKKKLTINRNYSFCCNRYFTYGINKKKFVMQGPTVYS